MPEQKEQQESIYQLVKDLTSEKPGRSIGQVWEMSYRRTRDSQQMDKEYCSELYNTVLNCSQHPEEDLQPILHEEVEITVAALKKDLIIYQQNLFK